MALENRVFPVKLGMTSFKSIFSKGSKNLARGLETQYILHVTD